MRLVVLGSLLRSNLETRSGDASGLEDDRDPFPQLLPEEEEEKGEEGTNRMSDCMSD